MKRSLLGAALLLIPSLSAAAGMPELPADLRPFLRRTASAARTPSAGPVRDGLFERAREVYERLSRAGHVRTDVEFLRVPPPEDADMPAYVEYDYVRGVCKVFLGEKAMRKEGFLEEFGFRFALYHELSHCDLFANPRGITVFPGMSERANRMLSDYIQLEFLKVADEEELQAGAYHTYQENSADAKAVALLMAEGWPQEELLGIARRRGTDISTINDSHHSGGMFGRLFAADWGSMSPRELDREASGIADRHTAVNILSKRAFVDLLGMRPFSAELSDLVGATVMNYRYAGHTEKTREFIAMQTRQAGGSNHPVWRAFFRTLRREGTPSEAVEAFFQERYQARPDGLSAEDREIERALRGRR